MIDYSDIHRQCLYGKMYISVRQKVCHSTAYFYWKSRVPSSKSYERFTVAIRENSEIFALLEFFFE